MLIRNKAKVQQKQQEGPVSYTVAVGRGQILKWHVDQILNRHTDKFPAA